MPLKERLLPSASVQAGWRGNPWRMVQAPALLFCSENRPSIQSLTHTILSAEPIGRSNSALMEKFIPLKGRERVLPRLRISVLLADSAVSGSAASRTLSCAKGGREGGREGRARDGAAEMWF